ncbi:MAG: caspase family protein, partial [Acinetobacter guillouiae]
MLGGNETLAAHPLGLKQLESPPVSLKALIDWFLAPTLDAGNIGFCNDQAPLGTIYALASANNPVLISTPNTTVELDAATKNNIESDFESWLECLKSNDSNIGVFYFCGHGVMVTNHYLLAEDFGANKHRPWEKAFDISDTIRSVEREFKGALYFFVDACREVSKEVALSIGGDPQPLMSVNVTKGVSRSSLVRISGTGEGNLAFAPLGSEVSYFSKALLHALSGFAGIKAAGTPVWEVDGETLASAIRKTLERGWTSTAPQVS